MATTPALPAPDEDEEAALAQERSELLERLERTLEWPMLALGLAWVLLIVVELTGNLSAAGALALRVIWVVFIAEFLLSLTLAPRKLDYLRAQWLTALSLAIPALRITRAFRFVRVLRSVRMARGLRLVRIVGATNRGTRALGDTMQRRGLGYVVAATLLVTVVGAAGLRAFEAEVPDGGFDSFGDALWFTAMLLTTIASERWPRTVEGRALCFLLSLYAMGVLGYITAALASYFVDRDAVTSGARGELAALRQDVQALRAELRELTTRSRPE